MLKLAVETSFHLNRLVVAVRTGLKQEGKLVLLRVVEEFTNVPQYVANISVNFLPFS